MAGGEGAAVGIDLGTTYSCVGAWKNGGVQIIVNEQGSRVTPSCVAFTDRERLIGDGALYQMTKNPSNTIFDVKRLIGRRFTEDSVQSDMRLWPFRVIAGEKDRPTIIVQYMGEEKRFFAEEISAMVLSKMKKMASGFLSCDVNKAVVTVPAYFDNAQRQATKEAGAIAGLEVLQVLNEPTAAALAYGLSNKETCKGDVKKLVLIFDLGGGTLDVTILQLEEHGVIEVKATCGDTHLGGQDFDNRMVDHLIDVIRRRHKKDMRENKKAIRKLKEACERAKRILSVNHTANVEIESLIDGDDFSMVFSRAKFEEINKSLFEKCIAPVNQCLKDGNVQKSSIDEIVLVGGSTRIPKVKQLLREFFDGKQLCNSVNEDEAVAFGATIQAATLNGNMHKSNAPSIVLLDVTPISLGLSDQNGSMKVVIPRNTRIPCKMAKSWSTSIDNQTAMSFYVYEGERKMAADNKRLGSFEIHGITPAPMGQAKLQVIFNMDSNGILNVTAKNLETKDKAGITISSDTLMLSEDEIGRMVREARFFENQDMERKKATIAKDGLERFVSKITTLVDDKRAASALKGAAKDKLVSALSDATEWMEDNQYATEDEFEEAKKDLMMMWEPIRVKLLKAGVRNLDI